MRRLAFLLVGAVLLAGCSGGSSAPTPEGGQAPAPAPTTSGDKVKVGFLVKSATENWFQMEWKFAKECAAKEGFELITQEVKDADKVVAEMDNLKTKGAQGVIICTPDQKLGKTIVDKAKENGLKLLTVDDRLVDADGKPLSDVHHLGISAHDIGKMVGQAIADEMKKRGWKPEEVGAIAVTFDELETAKERIAGASEVLVANGFKAENIFKCPWKNSTDIPNAVTAASTGFIQHPTIKKWVGFSSNDDGVLGIVRASEDRQIPADCMIGVGINGTSGVDDLKKDKPTGFFASVLLSPKKHGYDTAEMMYHWIKDGKEPPLETWTSGTVITRENFRKEMEAEGMTVP